MAQNVYDDPAFFEGYATLPRQTRGLDGAPEWPTVRAMLPDLAGKDVLDLGCGFGWAARHFRAAGAASVLGVDLSEKMIARARADTDDAAITYTIADLGTLRLSEAAFDFAYSSLAFHYVADFARLVAEIRRALRPGGGLLFTIEHPIFMAADRPAFFAGADGRPTWPVNRYALEGERRTDWFVAGVVKYHRTLATTLNTLIAGGFAVRAVAEFAPSPAEVAANPSLAEEVERPMLLTISAECCPASHLR